MRKPIIALLLALFLAPTASAAENGVFNDVLEGNAHFEAIKYVKDYNIVGGYEDGSYRPEKEVNRAEFLKILMETKYNEEMASAVGSDCFNDIAGDEWFAKYVCAAEEKGIISGYPDGSFKPANTINIIEALKILLETMMEEEWEVKHGGVYDEAIEKVLKNVPETLTDVRDAWYEKYLLPIEHYSLMLDEWTSFDGLITRGETAEIVYRMDFLMKEEAVANRPGDWETVKDFVLAKYPLSESYFDDHYSYVESALNVKVTDWKNWLGGRYHIGIADAVTVGYEFSIKDSAGEDHALKESMWMHAGQVIENGYVNTSFYTPEGFVFDRYREPAVTYEVAEIIPRTEAIEIAKGEPKCIDPEWFDVAAAENDLTLLPIGGKIFWMWQSGLSECRINADTGVIENIEQMLPD